MDKIRVKEAVIVEGRYDAAAIRRVVDGIVLETGGFSIFSDEERLSLFRRLARERGLLILTDSDGAGFVIRNFLKGAIPKEQIKQAYIPDIYGKERRKSAPSREGKLGVEGMDAQTLRACIIASGAATGSESPPVSCPVTKQDLYRDGLCGGPDSAILRQKFLVYAGLPVRMSANAMLEMINILYGASEYRRLLEAIRPAR